MTAMEDSEIKAIELSLTSRCWGCTGHGVCCGTSYWCWICGGSGSSFSIKHTDYPIIDCDVNPPYLESEDEWMRR